MTFQMLNSSGTLVVAGGSKNVYFMGRAISLDGAAVVTDRLGSVLSRAGAAVDYFPYGEEKTTTANPAEKFGAYLRDATGLDYADQRYFSSGIGRFMTSDPYEASGGAGEPSSWNRIAYVQDDPVNFIDRKGLNAQNPDEYCSPEYSNCDNLIVGPVIVGGGGGGVNSLRPVGSAQARDKLAQKDCYQLFGYTSASQAQNAFDRIKASSNNKMNN